MPNLKPVCLKYIAVFSLIIIPALSNGQREALYKQYPREYFDSIRVIINDTTKEYYTIEAYRLQKNDRIDVDGKLNEPAWHVAQHRGDLLEKEPYPLIPMSEKTEFSILYDEENLYLGVWCFDSEPHRIVTELSPRETSAPDHLMIFIDSYHDHRTGYKFMVTPTGVQGDELRYDDIKRDGNWNGIWYSEGSVDERGWYAEVKIPFYNFRYPRETVQTWGFNIMRTMSKETSRGQWKPHLPEWENTTRMSQLGHIENIRNIKPGRTFEVRPYGVAGSVINGGNSPKGNFSFGGDVRYTPTPNITADFTINPDFAQVDADVFEINLTRFPTRFKELRPFFTERINIFNTPLELFYSRRIGARGDILGGVKMTGKFQHGVEFGVLGNMTGESFFSSSSLSAEKASFGVMRVKKDILGSSSIGILAATKEEPDRFNRIAGVDGSLVLSHHDIIDLQLAKGMTETNNDRNTAYLLSYLRTGDLLGGSLNFEWVEPFFEINRVGYIKKEADRGWNRWNSLLKVSPRINKHHIRRITANLRVENETDFFTDQYINRWLQAFPNANTDPVFGEVSVESDGKRYVSDGTRKTGNISLGGDLTVTMMNEMYFLAGYKNYSATELTGSFHGELWNLSYSTTPLKSGKKFAGILSAESGSFYNFDQKYTGYQQNIVLQGEGRIHRNLITTLDAGYTVTEDPSGIKDGKYYKISSNSNLMFTKDFFFRLHAQGIFGTTYYETTRMLNEYLLSGLVSWEYRPGSFLYLAYNEGRYDQSGPEGTSRFRLLNRTLLMKISWFFSV